MNQPMVLCYNMAGERAEQVRALALKAGIQPFLVPREAYAQTIGALCGLEVPTEEAYEGEGFEEELMLLAFLEKGMLSLFLDGFRNLGIPSVPLKAMLTENNATWNSLKLREELFDEYIYFKNLRVQANKKK